MIGAALGVASAIRAGLAYVELDTDDDPLIAGLNRAQKRLTNWGKGIGVAGAALTATGAGILAPIGALFVEAVSRGEQINNLAKSLGSTSEEVSKLAYAFEAAGLEMNDFLDASKTLDQQIAAALSGNQEAAATFLQLGTNAQALSKMDLGDKFATIGQGLSEVTLSADKTNVAMKLLGGAGQKALRLFTDNNAGLKRLTAQAEEVGAVMSGETADGAASVAASFREVKAAVTNAGLAIGEALLPHADTIKDFARQAVIVAGAVRRWVKENTALITGVVAAGAALAGTGLVLTGFGISLAAAGVAIGGFVIALKALAAFGVAVFGVLTSPLGLTVAALTVGIAAWAKWTDSGQATVAFLKGELVGAFSTLKDTAVDAWGGITAAIASGDLQGAAEIALDALKVAWEQTVATLRNIWSEFRDWFADMLDDLSVNAGAAWQTIADAMQPTVDAWNSSMALMSGAWDVMLADVGAAWDRGLSDLTAGWNLFTKNFLSEWVFAVGLFGDYWDAMVAGAKAAFLDMIAVVLGPTLALAQLLHLDTMVDDVAAALNLVKDLGGEVAKDLGRDFDQNKAKRAADAADRKADREAEREADREDARNAVADARQRMLDRIKAQANQAWLDKLLDEKEPAAKKKGPDVAAAGSVARGIFAATGNLAGVFGVGNTMAERQIRATDKVRDAVEDVGAKIDKLGPRFS